MRPYPSLALEVRNQRDMESFDQLLAGELDLAVRSREALPHGLRFEPLFASDRMLIVPRGHELAGKKRPTLRDLARHAFVIPPAGSTSRRLIEAAFLRAGLRLEIAMEAGGWEIVKRLVRARVGVAVVPRWGDSGGASLPSGCPWAGDAGGYRRLIRNGRRDAVAGGGGEEGGVGGKDESIRYLRVYVECVYFRRERRVRRAARLRTISDELLR